MTRNVAAVVLADLSLTTIPVPSAVGLGGNVNFVTSVLNRGPDPATGVVVSNTLPAGSVFVSANTTVGACAYDAGLLRCDLGTLASNANANVTLTARATEPGVLSMVATVQHAERELDLANNTAQTVAI